MTIVKRFASATARIFLITTSLFLIPASSRALSNISSSPSRCNPYSIRNEGRKNPTPSNEVHHALCSGTSIGDLVEKVSKKSNSKSSASVAPFPFATSQDSEMFLVLNLATSLRRMAFWAEDNLRGMALARSSASSRLAASYFDERSVAISCAVLADLAASPASFESNRDRVSFPWRIHVSNVAILDSAYSSPVTPTATSAAPTSPKTNNAKFGLSGGCTMPRLKSCKSSTYSQITNTISNKTPNATSHVQASNSRCNKEPQSLALASALLSADSSMLAFHEGQEHLAKLQLIAVTIIFSVGILTLIGIGLWDKYIS